MAMLQHYYTSCEKGTSGSAGFQCKAMSAAISPQELKAINNIIGYRIPPTMDEYDIPRHPIALRYDYLHKDKCLLVCSQSNGTDEKGRPGNFFAHSVITHPQDFAVFPPIMFWRHNFWRTNDPSESLEIPPEHSFELEPSLEFEQIWHFLDQGNRRQWFYKLLCATIHHDNNKRAIIILDEIDNVAHWIAAVTFALPTVYRPFLTFATYHHDPYQSPFRLTGTTADSKFRFSSDEYISYFILNAQDNRISEIEDSEYAKFVSQNFEPERYESKLLAFFDWCNKRLPPRPGRLADRLDPATYRYLTIEERQLSLDNPNARRHLTSLLEETQRTSHLSAEQIEDLHSATELIADALRRAPSLQLMQEYGRAQSLLKKHNQPFAHQIQDDLWLMTELILERDQKLASRWASICRQLYSHYDLTQTASNRTFITTLTNRFSEADCQLHDLLWTHLGPYFRANRQNTPQLSLLIQQAFYAVDSIPHSAPLVVPPEADKLLRAILDAFPEQKLPLDNALAWRDQSLGNSFSWLYYLIVEKLPLEKREPYRKYVRHIAPEIRFYEMRRDIEAAPVERLVSLLETWGHHSQDEQNNQRDFFSQGFKAAWKRVEASERKRFAEQFLSSPGLPSLLHQQQTEELLDHVFSTLTLSRLEPETAQLYETYLHYTALTIDQRALIGGSLAMTKGTVDEESAQAIQDRLSQAHESTYEREASQLMARFFEQDVTLESHIRMIQAIYVPNYQIIFWELYWDHFRELLFDGKRTPDLINMLSYWFDQSLTELVKQPYVAQSFFLQLPAVLEEAKSDKKFRRMTYTIRIQAKEQPWYSLISKYIIPEKKRGILGFFRT